MSYDIEDIIVFHGILAELQYKHEYLETFLECLHTHFSIRMVNEWADAEFRDNLYITQMVYGTAVTFTEGRKKDNDDDRHLLIKCIHDVAKLNILKKLGAVNDYNLSGAGVTVSMDREYTEDVVRDLMHKARNMWEKEVVDKKMTPWLTSEAEEGMLVFHSWLYEEVNCDDSHKSEEEN